MAQIDGNENKCGWDSCLTCPYPLRQCPLEERKERWGAFQRRQKTIELKANGKDKEEIAKEIGRSVSTVRKYLQEVGKG